MKQLIVALALFTLFLIGIVYQADYSKVKIAERDLKQQTEDSAAGAIFCIDVKKYAEGNIVFDDDRVVNYVQNTLPPEYITGITIFDETMRKYENGVLSDGVTTITYPYHYTDESGYRVLVRNPSITITATKKTGDLYRLPFLEKKEIRRSSMYTFEGR